MIKYYYIVYLNGKTRIKTMFSDVEEYRHHLAECIRKNYTILDNGLYEERINYY